MQTQSPIIALCKSLIIQGNKVGYTREGDNTNEICLNLYSAGCGKRRKTLKLGNNTIQMIMFLVSKKEKIKRTFSPNLRKSNNSTFCIKFFVKHILRL